jgi:hypothetical protein
MRSAALNALDTFMTATLMGVGFGIGIELFKAVWL